jgi:hypothetical protein
VAKNFMYWVIVAGAQPTAFRSRQAEDLLPTLRQLQRTQPDVTLKWYERGRFWEDPAAAKEAQLRKRDSASSRGREWRPGGKHVDPRAKYDIPRDERRARFKKRLVAGRRRPEGESKAAPEGERPPATKLSWKPPRPAGVRSPGARPTGPRSTGPRPRGPQNRGRRPPK